MRDFAYRKLGYSDYRELGPGEIVEVSAEGVTQLAPAGNKMRICAFLWSYYGYPTSSYEGVNVEMMRYKNGELFAKHDAKTHDVHAIDYVGGVPDSGTPHAIGYANACKVPFARPYIKYTPTWVAQLYARQSDGAQQSCQNEAYTHSRADRGQAPSACG